MFYFFSFFEVVSLFNYQGSYSLFFLVSLCLGKCSLPRQRILSYQRCFALSTLFFTFFQEVFFFISRVNDLYLNKRLEFCQHFFYFFFEKVKIAENTGQISAVSLTFTLPISGITRRGISQGTVLSEKRTSVSRLNRLTPVLHL